MNTIFGYVATLISNREDVATQALHYILGRSPQACQVVQEIAHVANHDLPDVVGYHVWPTSMKGQGKPDMRGVSSKKDDVLFIESKLWAGLTEHQPVTYLSRLPDGGVLLFIVLEQRTNLVEELDRKLDNAQFASSAWNQGWRKQGVRWRKVNGKFIAVVGWELLLDELRKAVDNQDQGRVSVSDVDQLRGFIQEAAGEAQFIPFDPAQLSGLEIPSLIDSVRIVIDKVWSNAEQEGLATTTRVRQEVDEYGYHGTCNGIEFWFGLYYNAWRKFGSSPVWIGVNVRDRNNRNPQAIFQALSALANSHSILAAVEPQCVADDPNLYIPVFLEARACEEDVVEGVLKQLRELKRELDGIP